MRATILIFIFACFWTWAPAQEKVSFEKVFGCEVKPMQAKLCLHRPSPIHTHPILRTDTLFYRRFFDKIDPKKPWVPENMTMKAKRPAL